MLGGGRVRQAERIAEPESGRRDSSRVFRQRVRVVSKYLEHFAPRNGCRRKFTTWTRGDDSA